MADVASAAPLQNDFAKDCQKRVVFHVASDEIWLRAEDDSNLNGGMNSALGTCNEAGAGGGAHGGGGDAAVQVPQQGQRVGLPQPARQLRGKQRRQPRCGALVAGSPAVPPQPRQRARRQYGMMVFGRLC